VFFKQKLPQINTAKLYASYISVQLWYNVNNILTGLANGGKETHQYWWMVDGHPKDPKLMFFLTQL